MREVYCIDVEAYKTYILNFSHSGTLALSAARVLECQKLEV